MSVQVGIGTFPGQVPVGDNRPVAGVYQDILGLARVADEAVRPFAAEVIPALRRPVAPERAR